MSAVEIGDFVAKVGLPVALIVFGCVMSWYAIRHGGPFLAQCIKELISTMSTFLDKLNEAHKDMADAVAKLAASVAILADNSEKQSSEVLPRIQATLTEVAAELRKKAT